jgi:predicted methyltransferase
VGATVDAWYGEPRRDEHPCGECDGHGMVLTDEGHDLLRFLDRYFERRRRS